MTVAVWPTVSPVPGLVTPAVAVSLVVAVELAAAGVAPPEADEALLLPPDDPPLLPHAPSSRVVNTANVASRPR